MNLRWIFVQSLFTSVSLKKDEGRERELIKLPFYQICVRCVFHLAKTRVSLINSLIRIFQFKILTIVTYIIYVPAASPLAEQVINMDDNPKQEDYSETQIIQFVTKHISFNRRCNL